jgi:hypothetical protein
MRDAGQTTGERIQEGAAQVSQRLGEGYGMLRDEAGRRYQQVEGMVAQTPTTSVLFSFGLGFGLGLVLTSLLARPEESWAERYLPDRLRRASDSFGHLTESIRDLPESMRRHMPRSMRG